MGQNLDQPPFSELQVLYAEKIGELTDRLAKIEAEHGAQTVPIDAALKAQQSAMLTLEAALKGIQSLRAHVLENDLGKVSVRVEELAKQTDAALRALEQATGENTKAITQLAGDASRMFDAENHQRQEMERARAGEVQGFEARVEAVRNELRATFDAAKAEFATPKTFNPRGKHDPKAVYARLDVAEFNGSSYASLEDDNTEQPGRKSRKWMLIALRGGGSVANATALEYVGVPASPTAPGAPGQRATDANYVYECVAGNTWRRVPLAKWS